MLGKLDIYRKFTNALAVTVIVSVGWICYEVNLLQATKSNLSFTCHGILSTNNAPFKKIQASKCR